MNPLAHIQITPRGLGEPLDRDSLDLGCSVPCGEREPLRFGLPLVVRNIHSEHVGEAWIAFATLMQRLEIPLRGALTEWANLENADKPLRQSWCSSDNAFDVDDLQHADLFEIDLRTGNEVAWSLRPELRKQDSLKALVDTLRLVRGKIAVGVTLPAGASSEDIQLVCNSGVDFVTVVERNQLSLLGISTLRAIQEFNEGTKTKVIVDATVESLEDIVKCVALGASAVSVDSLLRPIIKRSTQSSDSGSGMLSGIASTASPAKNLLKEVTLTISSFRERLEEALGLTGCSTVSEFNNSYLVATNADVARIAGVTLLGS